MEWIINNSGNYILHYGEEVRNVRRVIHGYVRPENAEDWIECENEAIISDPKTTKTDYENY